MYVLYLLNDNPFTTTQESIVYKKRDRCLFARALYRDKPGGDDWRSWILHSAFKCIFLKHLLTPDSENGQILKKKIEKVMMWLSSKANNTFHLRNNKLEFASKLIPDLKEFIAIYFFCPKDWQESHYSPTAICTTECAYHCVNVQAQSMFS